MSDYKFKIGITQGDTNGIGWEVILKVFTDSRMAELCTPVIYGSPNVAAYYRNRCRDLEQWMFNICTSAEEAKRGKVNIIVCPQGEIRITAGKPSREGAAAAMASLDAAAADLSRGALDAIVTAPIDKESMHEAGFAFTGHTEYFASKFDSEAVMIMCSDRLRVGLATVHIPVAEVSRALSVELIESRIMALRKSMTEDFGIVEPRIAVLALNPHAGDGGLLGDEEERIIRPAVIAACEKGALAFGPLSADGLFANGAYAHYDVVLAMYHDQGLMPFKTLSPDGVNFTAGLPVVRTSPDHGVAYDIAGQGKADAQSMRNAVYAAIDIAAARRRWAEWSRRPLERFERERGRDVSVKDLPETEDED